MNNADFVARDLTVLWHPCTQMKDHEWLPLVPIRRGDGVWLEDFDGRPLPGRHQLVVGQPVRARQSAHQFGAIADQARTLEHVILGRLHARAGA